MYDRGSIPGGGMDFFSSSLLSDRLCGPRTCPMGTGGTLPLIKRPEREVGHSPASSAEVKNAWRYTSIPPYVFTAWCLIK
jgi:hypothetical protein